MVGSGYEGRSKRLGRGPGYRGGSWYKEHGMDPGSGYRVRVKGLGQSSAYRSRVGEKAWVQIQETWDGSRVKLQGMGSSSGFRGGSRVRVQGGFRNFNHL